MGYTTNFSGVFEVTPPMSPETMAELNKLSEDRHDEEGYPGIWCQWIPGSTNTIEWDGNEKFYNYVEWLDYIIEKILKPKGYVVNGEVEWYGEDNQDRGCINVTDNKVMVGVLEARYSFETHVSEYKSKYKTEEQIKEENFEL